MSIREDFDDEPVSGAPAWTVTFADMMSLLLTFFILLISMSDLRLGEQGEATIASLRQQFGHETRSATLLPAPTLAGDRIDTASIFARQFVAASGVLFFEENSVEVSPTARETLEMLAPKLADEMYLIEVRGHASVFPSPGEDRWDLAYRRCHAVMQRLVEFGVSPHRLRLTSAGDNQPLSETSTAAERTRNARVEIVMWDELVR